MIVFTSNIFAILGLRSLYFVWAGALDRFHSLKRGVARGIEQIIKSITRMAEVTQQNASSSQESASLRPTAMRSTC